MSVHFDVVSKAQQFRPLFNKKRPARQQQPVFSTLNAFLRQDEKIAMFEAIFNELNILPWQFWPFRGFGELANLSSTTNTDVGL